MSKTIDTPDCGECHQAIAQGEGFSFVGLINRPMSSTRMERIVVPSPGDGTLPPSRGVLLSEPIRNLHFRCLESLVRKHTAPAAVVTSNTCGTCGLSRVDCASWGKHAGHEIEPADAAIDADSPA